jgi:dephospho-CoA kinase
MKKIGVTGSIGSGKTLVCSIFEKLGVPVFNADREAKMAFMDENISRLMIERFGEDIYVDKGMIDRKKLAGMLFGNEEAVAFVNSLVHPSVRKKFDKWTGEHPSAEYLIYEAAILFETGYYKQLDATILVVAPEELRLKRVISRDNVDEESLRKRMGHQWPDEKKIPLADYIINNDEKHTLIGQVVEVHDKIVAKPN